MSVGNIGQLAVDLIIASLGMEKIGYFYDRSLLPVVGNDPYARDDAQTDCQLVTSAEGIY